MLLIFMNKCFHTNIRIAYNREKSLHHVTLVAMVSGSQQTVVPQIGQKIVKRLTCMTFPVHGYTQEQNQ